MAAPEISILRIPNNSALLPMQNAQEWKMKEAKAHEYELENDMNELDDLEWKIPIHSKMSLTPSDLQIVNNFK